MTNNKNLGIFVKEPPQKKKINKNKNTPPPKKSDKMGVLAKNILFMTEKNEIHVIEYLHEEIVFRDVFCSTVAFILHFVPMSERFNSLNLDPTLWLDKIGHMVNSLVSVIHSNPKP